MVNNEWKCEASVEIEAEPTGKHRVIYCGKPAKLHGIAAICDEHWEILREKWRKE